MSLYRRGNVWWYEFQFRGERVRCSSGRTNKQDAKKVENDHLDNLRDRSDQRALLGCRDVTRCGNCSRWLDIDKARGAAGLFFCDSECEATWERKISPRPTLKEFSQTFIDYAQSHTKPRTVEFYTEQSLRLCEFEPLASARLNTIDEVLIESFVQYRGKSVSPATVNRALATLRRMLGLAHEWRKIDRIPKIRRVPGEVERQYVLGYEQEAKYLAKAPRLLADIATVMLDTGLRVGEALGLGWDNVHLNCTTKDSAFGYIHIKEGKSKNAIRNVALTSRAHGVLADRKSKTESEFVFAEGKQPPMLVSSLGHVHTRLRRDLKLSPKFVLHSLRHTCLTRMGMSHVDAFTLMRFAGHSSVTVSQKYVHPTPEAMGRAVASLEAHNRNQKALAVGQN